MNFTGVLKTGVFKHMVAMVTITEKNTKMSNLYDVSEDFLCITFVFFMYIN